jgi:hypothetical protein
MSASITTFIDQHSDWAMLLLFALTPHGARPRAAANRAAIDKPRLHPDQSATTTP